MVRKQNKRDQFEGLCGKPGKALTHLFVILVSLVLLRICILTSSDFALQNVRFDDLIAVIDSFGQDREIRFDFEAVRIDSRRCFGVFGLDVNVTWKGIIRNRPRNFGSEGDGFVSLEPSSYQNVKVDSTEAKLTTIIL